MRLILASGSPRRVELLKTLADVFEVIPSDIEEVFNLDLPEIGDQVSDLAAQKALAVAQVQTDDCLVIGADTIVYLEQCVLGKPHHDSEAERMLKALSGQWHEVITGVALVRRHAGQFSQQLGHAVSRVKMRDITLAEITAYVQTKEPLDKAGAYAIQGGAGAFVEEIQGSYENIVGLPLDLLAKMLSADPA